MLSQARTRCRACQAASVGLGGSGSTRCLLMLKVSRAGALRLDCGAEVVQSVCVTGYVELGMVGRELVAAVGSYRILLGRGITIERKRILVNRKSAAAEE